MRSQHVRCGLAVLALLLILGSAVAAAPPASALARVNALWVAESKGTLKIATAEGELLFEIGDSQNVRAVVVDESREAVWLYAGSTLFCYSFDGTRLLSVPTSLPNPARADLAVNEDDGSVWLGAAQELWSFSVAGAPLLSLHLPQPLLSLDVDPSGSLLWVGTSASASAYDAVTGILVRTIAVSDLRDLGVDPTSGQLWIARQSGLTRYDSDGSFLGTLAIPQLGQVVAGSNGGAWAATQKAVVHVSASGQVLSSLEPFGGQADIVELVVDLADGSAWVAGTSSVAQISAAGELRRVFDIEPPVHILDLAVSSDTAPPELEIQAPVGGSFLATGTPTVRVRFSDVGVGVDSETLSFQLDGSALAVTCAFDDDGASCAPASAIPEGPHTLAAGVRDLAGNLATAEAAFTVDTTPPTVSVLQPPDGTLRNQPLQTLTGVVSETVTLTVNGVSATVAEDLTFSFGPVALQEGVNAFVLVATDRAGNIGRRLLSVTLDSIPPSPVDAGRVTVTPVTGGQVLVTGAPGGAEPGTTVSITNSRTTTTVTVSVGPDGSFSATLDAQAGDSLSIALADAAGNRSATVNVTVPVVSEPGLPPDPATVAPPLDPTVAPDIAASTEFLYTGADPIQEGVAPGTIDPKRVAVLRGRVLDRSGTPLPDVRVSILSHSELGSTSSRADGMFDMAANGGGLLIVQYKKQGYLTAQRQVSAPWRDFVWADDVVLVPYDTLVTTISDDASQLQVARGSRVEDEDGARTATILFPAGTHATMVLADGTTQPLSTLSVRATEYTVGPAGPSAMPAPLPPTSGYTYAVELSVDEATAAGAKRVVFSQPVFFYVENFVGFPVGSQVPTGFYDRDLGAWVSAQNGRVLKVLGVAGGLADLDVDGTGAPADGARLASLGITDDERRQLAILYQPGKSLWRSPIPHFSVWDCNWPYGVPPGDAETPDQPEAEPEDDRDEDPDCQAGSIIDCQNRALGESLPIVGTPFSLRYRSDRVPGRKAAFQMTIPLSGPRVPASLKRIELQVIVAGRLFNWDFSNAPDQKSRFTWDGKDAYGRSMSRPSSLIVKISYVYPALYQQALPGANSFALSSGVPGTVPSREDFSFSQTYVIPVGPGLWEAKVAGLGGWTLDRQHFFDPDGHRLHLGTGQTRSSQSSNYGRIISSPPGLDGLDAARCVTSDSQGNLYLCAFSRVVKVTPAGAITTVAGTGSYGFSGDGGPGLFAQLRAPAGVAVDLRGNIFIADKDDYRIRRVDPQGIITTVAGFGFPFGSYSPLRDNGRPATQVGLGEPSGVAVDREGNLYIASSSNNMILRVGLDGLIYGIAGNGGTSDLPGNLPTRKSLRGVRGIALDPSGDLWIADFSRRRIFRINAGGTMTQEAGQAPSLDLRFPAEIAVSRSGEVLIYDAPGLIEKLLPDGSLVPIAGNRSGLATDDGGPATAAGLGSVTSLAFDPEGNFLLAAGLDKVRRVSALLPGFTTEGEILIGSQDGEEVYVFSAQGRHLRTVNATNGATLLTFNYDSRGLLETLEDGDGNLTHIERDASGTPSAIVGPFGQRTALALDANGYLARVANPAGEATRFVYSTDGLMMSMTNPREKTTTFSYDALGFLFRDSDPAGGFKQLGRNASTNGTTVSLDTAGGRRFEYSTLKLTIGGRQKSTLLPTGLRRTSVIGTDGSTAVTYPDGTTTTLIEGPDPRFGMAAPVASTLQVRTPSGLVSTWSRSRTATLQEPGDPLSLIAATERVEINGRAFTRSYDAGQRKFTFTSPAGRQTSTTVDPLGRPVTVEIPGVAPLSFTYDARGRLNTISQGSGSDQRTLSLGYGADGWPTEVLGPLAYRIGFEQDGAGRLLRQTLPDGREIELSYDPNGNLAALTPPSRPSHSFSFTPVDLPAEYIPPALGSETNRTSYSYSLDRQLRLIDRPDGQSVELIYGAGRRLAGIDFSRGQIVFSYQPTTGNLSAVSAPEESLAYIYDGFLLIGSTWSGAVSGSVTSTYNSDFRVNSTSVNGANPITFQYDPDGLLSQVGGLTLTRSPQNGLLTGTTHSQLTTTQSYNSFGELAIFTASFAGTPLYATTYTRDQFGRILRKTETIGSTSETFGYTYDFSGRLTDVTRNGLPLSRYAYDGNGNRTAHTGLLGTMTAAYDPQDRLLSYGDKTYTYSVNGELTSKSQNGFTATYDYDELGNLRKVLLPEGITIEYVIDGLNRRVGKKVNGFLGQGFLYQDWLSPVAELDGTGAVVARFIYGSRPNVPDYMVKDGFTYRILSDHLGSPRLIINASSGEIVQRMDFDEFGRVLLDTRPGFQPFGFAGGLYDWQTALLRFGARDYDPELGRWTAKDPILFTGGQINLYGYVSNDPINFTDASGLAQFCKRGLGPLPLLGALSNNPIDDYFNTEIVHEQLLFQDKEGGNLGFFDSPEGGAIRPDKPENLPRYRACGPKYNDALMRQAVKNINPGDYELFDNNCENWAERVRNEYRRLVHKVGQSRSGVVPTPYLE